MVLIGRPSYRAQTRCVVAKVRCDGQYRAIPSYYCDYAFCFRDLASFSRVFLVSLFRGRGHDASSREHDAISYRIVHFVHSHRVLAISNRYLTTSHRFLATSFVFSPFRGLAEEVDRAKHQWPQRNTVLRFFFLI